MFKNAFKRIKVPSSPSKIILSFIVILLLYGVAALYLFPEWLFDNWSFEDLIFDSVNSSNLEGGEGDKLPGGLFISFAASALQDIIFFFITGIALLIYTTRRPEDDNLSQKLTYLFPQAKDDPLLRKYLEESVNKLGCMSDKSSFVFTIMDYNEDIGSFKVQVHFESHLRNLHNKDSYSDPKLAMTLYSDLDEPPPGGLYGQLEHVKIHNFNDDAITDVSDSDHSYPINMQEKLFTHNCPFTLPPHAIALFDAKHWDWSPSSNPHYLRVSRFTRSMKVRCVNSCGRQIFLETKVIPSDEEGQEQELNNHDSHELSLTEVSPRGGVELKIRVR